MNDLISRSALLEALNKLYMAALRKTAHSVETIYELDHLSMLVKDAPAVDAEVVRHGRWLFRMRPGGTWFCSECGHVSFLATKTSYCAHCGARMDGGADGD